MIVDVVNTSGSLDQLSDFIRAELLSQIRKLTSTHRFNVILAKEDDTFSLANGLVQANEDNKLKLERMLASALPPHGQPEGRPAQSVGAAAGHRVLLQRAVLENDVVEEVVQHQRRTHPHQHGCLPPDSRRKPRQRRRLRGRFKTTGR